MSKTTTLITHIDPELKTQAEALLLEAGFTTEQAITWFYQWDSNADSTRLVADL